MQRNRDPVSHMTHLNLLADATKNPRRSGPSPGGQIGVCLIDRNTRGVVNGGAVVTVTETTEWIQHAWLTVPGETQRNIQHL